MISNRKILVVQIGKLGDMVLTTPLFFELNKYFPNDEIFVLASKTNFEIPKNINFIKKSFIFDKNIFRLIPQLISFRFTKFDLLIDIKPEYSKTSELIRKFLKPKKYLGYDYVINEVNKKSGELIKSKHYLDLWLSAMYLLKEGFTPEYTKPVLKISENNKNKFDISINISSGYEIRNWDLNNWKIIIDYCLKLGHRINVIYDKYHIDKLSDLKHSFKNKICYSITDLNSKINDISASKCVISTDTSIVHIAAAFNKPVIALFTDVDWNMERFYPKSDKSIVLISDSKDSVNSIKPEEVIKSIEEFKSEGIL